MFIWKWCFSQLNYTLFLGLKKSSGEWTIRPLSRQWVCSFVKWHCFRKNVFQNILYKPDIELTDFYSRYIFNILRWCFYNFCQYFVFPRKHVQLSKQMDRIFEQMVELKNKCKNYQLLLLTYQYSFFESGICENCSNKGGHHYNHINISPESLPTEEIW